MKKSIFRNLHATIKENLFKDIQETVLVYLRGTNTKGSTYDPFRNTGYTVVNQTPYPIHAMIRELTTESLIMRELGLVESGAIELLVECGKTNFFRICEKVEYNNIEYSPYREALGNKVQITSAPLGFDKVILFRKGN